MSTDARNAAIRDAKRYVLEILRNDWTFEPSTDSGLPARCSPRDPDHDVLEWRLREYDNSGSELEPQTSPAIGGPTTRAPTAYDDSSSQPSSPVLSAAGGRAERRRKRRRQMEEEMRWNEGLRTWVERRDAWTGARTRSDICRGEGAPSASVAEGSSMDGGASSSSATAGVGIGSQDTYSGSTSSRPLSRSGESSNLAAKTDACLSLAEQDAQSQPDREGEERSVDLENKRKESTETGITEPDHTHKPTVPEAVTGTTPAPAPATAAATAMASSVHHQPGVSEEPLIPVAPSLIPASNPIRASITPAMYPSIYSKVVIQGLTPTVPINLADVTKAMVQGWKSDGQWPPKPATTNIVLADDATVPRVDDAADKPASPESKRRSSVANAVRKVFNFSGFHPHPFHRRGSSHSSNQHPEAHDGQAAEGSSVAAGSANAVHPERR